jgi:hypothetical protein
MEFAIDPADVRSGRVRGRYFRENFAQAGIDLAQIVPELVTNADAAIAASGRASGAISLRFAPPDGALVEVWRETVKKLRVPAIRTWHHELSCQDDGEGIDAATVDARLGALGVASEGTGRRGLFGRGLRDVWLARGGGRIRGVRGDQAVESWFFPAAGDEPYVYAHVVDAPASPTVRGRLGIAGDGTCVTVPLASGRLPASARLRTLVADLVQLRPVLEDPARQVFLELPDRPVERIAYSPPERDPERPILFDDEVAVMRGVVARVVVYRSADPIPLSSSRATRRGGIVIRSGRAAHEATLAGLEGRSGARHLFGEARCEAIERLQREALDSPRPEVVVRVDRGGLNDAHPLVQRLHASLERILRPLVEAEERRAGSRVVRAGRAVVARDSMGLKALNDALRTAFDAPGKAGFGRDGGTASAPPEPGRAADDHGPPHDPGAAEAAPEALDDVSDGLPTTQAAMRFKQSPIRLHPGEQRGISLLFDPARVPPGTPIEMVADPGLRVNLWRPDVADPVAGGWSRVTATIRALASAEPGSRLAVTATAGGHDAEMLVHVVRHRAGGWVREIARKEEDAPVEAEFDPETGIVTVFEGRREFRALERGARRAGLTRQRVREYLPYRMLEVEVAANAVYAWAAERILERRLPGERPADPAEYAAAVRLEAQTLRHVHHERLMRAFLGPEVFDGVVLAPSQPATDQLSLDGD